MRFDALRATDVPPEEQGERGDRCEPETEAARWALPTGGRHQDASRMFARMPRWADRTVESWVSESARDTDRTRRSNSSRASITRRPQDAHRRPMSAPTRVMDQA